MTHSQPQGFLAVPPTGTGPGVLVLHAWWGLNDTMKAFCTQLAESGFVAFAPDLYHGKVADNIADAETLGKALDTNHLQAKAEIADATMFLNGRLGQADGGLAVIGFSLGAYYALDLAAADPEHIRSVVLFYGTGEGDYSKSRAAYLGHFAERDEFEPKSNIDKLEESLRRAGRPVTFYRYSGTGHWFFEPDRLQAYSKAAASLAWDRTLAFLKRSSTLQETPSMERQPETTLVELIRYNNWANTQILAVCQELTADQLAATAPGTYGTLRATLEHIIRAEADYVGRMMGDRPQPWFKWEDQPALADLSAFAGQVSGALLDAAQRIPPTHIVHEEENGNTIDYQARHLFMQAINHGIEHRTNITTILSGLGLPAPEVDGWGYLFSHPDRFEMKEGSVNL